MAWLALVAGLTPVLYGANRGFDPRDEAFYLLWIMQPGGYAATIHIFGLPLHLAYEALGHSLIALRVAGVIAVVLTAAALGWALQRHYCQRFGVSMPGLPVHSALFGLTFYSFWILTPSYNLLANCGAALVFAGVLSWTNVARRRDELLGAIGVGAGGTFCFFGKPTLALLAALAVAGWLLLDARTSPRRAMARTAAAGAVCLTTLLPTIAVTMSFSQFVAMLREGQRTLDIGNSIFALPLKTVREIADASPIWWLSLTLMAIILWLAAGFEREPRAARRLHLLAGAVLAIDLVTLLGASAYGVMNRLSPYTAMVLAMPLHATTLAIAGLAASRSGGDPGRFAWVAIAPLLILLLLPFGIASGTVNNLLVQTEISAGFALLFALIAASLWGGKVLATATRWGATAAAVAIVWWGAAIPFYYATPIFHQDRPVRLPFTSDTMRVDPGMLQYIERMRRLAPIVQGAPVIDLSGFGPGSALLLGGRAPFYPWLAPGYRGVAERADQAWISLSPEERARAWIIGPIDQDFADTQVARDVLTHAERYTLADRVPGVYWQQRQALIVWRPRIATPAQGRPPGRSIEGETE